MDIFLVSCPSCWLVSVLDLIPIGESIGHSVFIESVPFLGWYCGFAAEMISTIQVEGVRFLSGTIEHDTAKALKTTVKHLIVIVDDNSGR